MNPKPNDVSPDIPDEAAADEILYLRPELEAAADRFVSANIAAQSVACSREGLYSKLSRGCDGSYMVVFDEHTNLADIRTAARITARENSPALVGLLWHGLEPERYRPRFPATARDARVRMFAQDANNYRFRVAQLEDSRTEADSPAEVARLLCEAHDLAFLVGHSDSADMGLDRLVMCPRLAVTARSSDKATLPCHHGGTCSRVIDDEARAVAPTEIGARLVIAATCWGMTSAGGALDPRFSVGRMLVQSKRVQALLTTIRTASFQPSELLLMYYMAVAGEPIGRIATAANRFRQRAGHDAEWLCFGDPTVRLFSEVSEATAIVDEDHIRLHMPPTIESGRVDARSSVRMGERVDEPILLCSDDSSVVSAVLDADGNLFATIDASSSNSPAEMGISDRAELHRDFAEFRPFLADLEFLEVMLNGVRARVERREQLQSVHAAKAELRQFLGQWTLPALVTGSRLDLSDVQRLWAQFQVRAHNLVVAQHALLAEYIGRTGGYQANISCSRHTPGPVTTLPWPCPYCGHAVEERIFTDRIGTSARHIYACDLCGIIADRARAGGSRISIPATIATGDRFSARVTVSNPYGFPVDTVAIAAIERGKHEKTISSSTPLEPLNGADSSEVAVEVHIPQALPPGTYQLGVCLIVGADLQFLRRPIHITHTVLHPLTRRRRT